MSPKIVQDLELTNTRVKYLIYVYPCGHRMVFSYLTLMTRAPCLRVSGTLRVVFPSLGVPPRSHYHRMEYDISAAAYSRLGGQMSSTRRRQGLLSRGRLSVTTKFFFVSAQVKTLNHGWQKAVIGRQLIEQPPAKLYACNPQCLMGFFYTSVVPRTPGHAIDVSCEPSFPFPFFFFLMSVFRHDRLRVFRAAIASSDACAILPCEHYNTVGPSCENTD